MYEAVRDPRDPWTLFHRRMVHLFMSVSDPTGPSLVVDVPCRSRESVVVGTNTTLLFPSGGFHQRNEQKAIHAKTDASEVQPSY